MNDANKRIIREYILEAASVLSGSLPEHWKHPKGRNPYAHIPKVIKSIMGSSYKDLDDSSFDAVMEIISYCKDNPF